MASQQKTKDKRLRRRGALHGTPCPDVERRRHQTAPDEPPFSRRRRNLPPRLPPVQTCSKPLIHLSWPPRDPARFRIMFHRRMPPSFRAPMLIFVVRVCRRNRERLGEEHMEIEFGCASRRQELGTQRSRGSLLVASEFRVREPLLAGRDRRRHELRLCMRHATGSLLLPGFACTLLHVSSIEPLFPSLWPR